MLDQTNKNLGYVCGRLFAVLEYAQEKANGKDHATIRERYMSAASATPAAVFATLLNLSNHHVEKIKAGQAGSAYFIEDKKQEIIDPQVECLTRSPCHFIEDKKQEIIDLLPADGVPAHLDLQDQGRFYVGYYHQMKDIYTKKDNTKE